MRASGIDNHDINKPYEPAAQQGVAGNTRCEQPRHGLAKASFVLGIVALILRLSGLVYFTSMVCSVLGIFFASESKKAGNRERIRDMGFTLCVIGTISGVTVFVAFVAMVIFATWR